MSEIIEQIPLHMITPSKGNRAIGGFDQDKLANLAESIKSVGVQQPAVVRAMGDGYELVAGERRWRASKLAGLETLPCVVRDLTDDQLLKIQVIENLQREDVHPLDEADGYERLSAEGGYDPELIAHEVGKSLTYVYQRLRLLKLCDEARLLLVEGKINVAVAVLLARLGEDQQRLVIKAQIQDWNIRRGVTAHEVDDWISINIMLEMKRAAWKMTDATLVKQAGPCSTCEKRTGADPALFDDITNDHCTDGVCYKSKQKAIMERNIKSLEGKEYLLVRETYGVPNTRGALYPHDWKKAKKSDVGAFPAIVINGPSPGKMVYAIKKEQIKSTVPDSEKKDPERTARDEKRIARLQARTNTNKKLFEKVMESLDNSENQLSLLHLFAKQEVECNDIDNLVDYYGWKPSEENPDDPDSIETAVYKVINQMDAWDTIGFLLAMKIEQALDIPGWGGLIASSIQPFLELYQINHEEVQEAEYAALGVTVTDQAEQEPEDQDDDDQGDGEDE